MSEPSRVNTGRATDVEHAEPRDRQVAIRRLQVLTERDDVDSAPPQVGERAVRLRKHGVMRVVPGRLADPRSEDRSHGPGRSGRRAAAAQAQHGHATGRRRAGYE